MSSMSATYSSPVTPPADLVTQGILDNISNVALNYANQVYNWGQGVFNNVMDVTNANIASLTQAADTAMTGANQSMGAFTNSFMPDYQTLRTTAANYANPARQSRNAGLAESSQMQAGEAARRATEANLQGYGIDVSSGRYADLDAANRTASAAAAAGAGTQSVRADESTALGLQNEALQYGIQLPGIAANFLNQANQATGLSENAITSAANTGANLKSLPNAYLNTAKVAYPPSGQSTSSTRSSTSPQSQSRTSGGPGGPGNSPGGQAPYNPNWDSAMNSNTSNSGWGNYQPNAGIQSVNGGTDPYNNNMSNPTMTDYSGGNSIYNGGQTDPYAADYGGYNTGYDQNTGTNLNGSDPNASYNDPYATSYGSDPNSYSATNLGNAPSDWNTYGTDTSGGGSSDQSFNTYGADTSGSSDQSYNMPDTSGFTDTSGDSGFAAGGAIPDGGQVPPQASPSMGRQTDDVHARLNAGEFVVPRDVAAWKGHEFFQKLIAQSRKARATAPAHGKPAAPPVGPVRFATR